MVLINIKIFNKFENLVILLSEQKFGDFGGGGTIYENKKFNFVIDLFEAMASSSYHKHLVLVFAFWREFIIRNKSNF